ncbi:MAG: ferredoxin [Sphingomonas bacterium]|nr:2Fe-2S iron-sulfur cluster-binding protein [Sphingomonas bacterium]MDB5688817.1 ferredoxin [Sphingomonas bacterium]
MTTQIHVPGSDISFPCESGETLLDAAERAGFAMPYACRKGVCSSCKGGLVSGSLAVGRSGRISGLHEDVLYCIARPETDVAIAPKWIVERKTPARRRYQLTVHRIDWPAPDVAILHLRLPIGRRIPFRAGQYARVFLPDGETRNYSLANAPHDNDIAMLHVRRVPGGRFSDGVLLTLAAGDTLDLELPYGLFAMSEDNRVPALLLATGTGFSSLKSMIEDLVRRRADRPVHLFWGGRSSTDLYDMDRALRWAERYPWFRFTPVLSRPGAGWEGAVGRVQDVAHRDYPDLSRHEVYACGNPGMVDEARALLTGLAGLAEDNFYADPYVPSGEAVPPP